VLIAEEMGVSGLFLELTKRGLHWKTMRMTADQIKALPARQRTIVVDGCAYASVLCFYDVVYGGCFRRMHSTANDIVKNFISLGFKLLVVVDGSLDKAKVSTWARRRRSELNRMAQYPKYITDLNAGVKSSKYAKAASGSVISIKSLLVELFKDAGCSVIMSAVEADREAAQLCITKGYFGVLSSDSDYLALGVPMLISSTSVSFSDNAVTFKYYSNADVCSALGVGRDFLPLFVSLCSLSSKFAFILCDHALLFFFLTDWERLLEMTL